MRRHIRGGEAMIQRLLTLVPLLSLSLCLTTSAPGCIEPTATYHFRVIDAQTAEPLMAVRVGEGWTGAHWGTRGLEDNGSKDLTPTDAQGETMAAGVMQSENFQYVFQFEIEGYKKLVVEDRGKSGPWTFSYLDTFDSLEGLKVIKVPTNPSHAILVPMYRLNGAANSPESRR
jgi:hypothetical protein